MPFFIALASFLRYLDVVVPPVQDIMLPLLRMANQANGQPVAIRNTVQKLADEMGLSDNDRTELLPSGRQSRFANRVTWAASHLRGAKVLESAGRGLVAITQRGKDLLASNLDSISLKVLGQFPDYHKWRNVAGEKDTPVPDAEESPEEEIERSYKALRAEIVAEVLARLKTCTPAFFEQIVVQLVVRMGYGGWLKDAGQAVGKSHDGGIDGVIKQDKLGLDVVYLQAKRWENTVGRREVQQFAGALAGQQANRGVFITTSDFSPEAVAYAKQVATKIVLINGKQLAEYMFDHDLGVTTTLTLSLKKIDSDFFEEE
jgi:restriction system protein